MVEPRDMPKHFVILGGGLAGSFIAARLCLAGQRVTLIDDQHPQSASRAAAGLFNVITGRFGAKSWQADQLLQEIRDFFAQPELAGLADEVLHYSPIYRPFKTEEEYNKWTGRAVDPEFAHLVDFQEEPLLPHQVINPLGGIIIRNCGWVSVGSLVDGLLLRLELHHHLRRLTGHLSYEAIDLESKTLQLRQEKLSFDHLICCEGYQLRLNPWFNFLRIIPNKGEILEIEAPTLKLPFALSKKVYLVPTGRHRWICGSTYANQFDDPNPTPEGRAEIEAQLAKAIQVPYTVVRHWTGIRPTTPNRRPILGTHPERPYLHVLGGFGTKGILLAPYTSRLLVEGILHDRWDIPQEVSLQRFLPQA